MAAALALVRMKYAAHDSHALQIASPEYGDQIAQCAYCMLLETEGQIREVCALAPVAPGLVLDVNRLQLRALVVALQHEFLPTGDVRDVLRDLQTAVETSGPITLRLV